MARAYNNGQFVHHTPDAILRNNFGRETLHCYEGSVRNNLGESADIRALECALIKSVPLAEMLQSKDHPNETHG